MVNYFGGKADPLLLAEFAEIKNNFSLHCAMSRSHQRSLEARLAHYAADQDKPSVAMVGIASTNRH